MAPPFQCKVAAGIGVNLVCAQACCLILSWGWFTGSRQGKARHGAWLSLLAREGASGGELMSNDATHLAAQQQATAPYPIVAQVGRHQCNPVPGFPSLPLPSSDESQTRLFLRRGTDEASISQFF